MASSSTDIACPTCDSPLVLEGTEAVGDEVFCSYCGAVYKVSAVDLDDGRLEFDEDW